jgi:hypothetical protein
VSPTYHGDHDLAPLDPDSWLRFWFGIDTNQWTTSSSKQTRVDIQHIHSFQNHKNYPSFQKTSRAKSQSQNLSIQQTCEATAKLKEHRTASKAKSRKTSCTMCAGHSTREQQGHHRDPELNIEDAIQLFQGSKKHRDLLNLTITSTPLLEYTDSATSTPKLNPNFWRIHPRKTLPLLSPHQ